MKNSITLLGRIPSKKNSKDFFYRGGRPILLPNKRYKEWHEEQSWALKAYKNVRTTGKVLAEFWMPDNRKTDLSNKWESVGDLLVDCGILEDDSWQIIPEIQLISRGVDKLKPRVVITFL